MKKWISLIVVAALLVAVGVGYFIYKSTVPTVSHNTQTSSEVIKETLKDTAKLITADYICTVVVPLKDQKKIKDFNIPFTQKSYIVSVNCTVSAGIENLSKAKIKETETKVEVFLPEIKIFEPTIDEKSFEILDEKNNIFNPITLKDTNDSRLEVEEKAKANAEKINLKTRAKGNAEKIIKAMLSPLAKEKKLVIEWQ